MVNDLGGGVSGEGASTRAADVVVAEIRAAGGQAVANYDSVEHGDKIVKTAIDTWGRVDVVINNAGILRDKSFVKVRTAQGGRALLALAQCFFCQMTQQDWDLVHNVHLRGSYTVTRAAWPHMREQGYGRIVCISSASGLYGNFGQANYSAAKLGVVGLALTLAKEGEAKNIRVNVVAPVAGSRMTETVMPPDLVAALKPEYVAPVVLLLGHESCPDTGAIFEVGAGWVAQVRWQRNEVRKTPRHGVVEEQGTDSDRVQGIMLPLDKATSAEAYQSSWSTLSDFTKSTHPTSTDLAMLASRAASAVTPVPPAAPKRRLPTSANVDPNVALGAVLPSFTRTFTPHDLIAYALAVGAAQEKPTCPSELRFTYENHEAFAMLPTMGVTMVDLMGLSPLPGLTFNPMMLLHGEHYLEVLNHPLPTQGTVTTETTLTELWDKEKAALVVLEAISKDQAGTPLFKNRINVFIRGIGGWGGERGPKPESFAPPARPADFVHRDATRPNQALLYRLPSGDGNPLHADPQMAAMGGFDRPILHGLCTFGFAVRAVLKRCADYEPRRFKSVNVRFSGHVFPGETLETHMWRVSDTRIVFETKTVERGTTVVSNAMVELHPAAKM